MLRVEKSSRFLHSYKIYEAKYVECITALDNVIMILASGHRLAPKYNDHALCHGVWKSFRECLIVEVSKNWLLIYRITRGILYLADTGSHQELFGSTKYKIDN
ncbi:MAG: type II toxin-antitoxin system YafQ family toxin [Mycoplasmataceae bacterium]|nr:type II toxin-antitoxin system YafQ family toxin [Mycoplasmataceae bacterium]